MVGVAIFMGIVLLVLFVFAMCAVSSQADRESEQMAEEYRRNHNER